MRGLNATAVASWVLQLLVAGILLQTLFFKFTGAAESVYIFSTLGAEPWGRVGSGVVELIASVLLLIPLTRFAPSYYAAAMDATWRDIGMDNASRAAAKSRCAARSPSRATRTPAPRRWSPATRPT